MAALRQEHRYGLSCGKINKSVPNKTIFHVKLTDTAIRTLEAYQNLKGSLPNQPAICFKGNQGYVKIPVPSTDSPDSFRVFSFYLSSDSKDKPQASFDCIHQYVSGDGSEHLEGQGSIQDKITVCATDDSYQMTRERMSQVEKDIWSRSAIEIKPGSTHPSKCVKIKKKQGLSSSFDNRHSPSNKRNGGPSLVAHRPLKERVIHILALKPYSKPELLLWLEREKASPKDKADLSAVLEEVAKLNPKDHSFTLKDDFYRHVRRDWPGYVEEERQLIQRVLARKLQPLSSSGSQLKSFQSNHSFHKTSEDSPSQLSPVKNLSMKRPVPSDHPESQTPKKQRILDQNMPLQSPSNGHLSTSTGRSSSAHGHASLQSKTEFGRGTNNAQQSPNALYQRHKLCESNSVPKQERSESAQQSPPSPKRPQIRTESEICTDQQLANGQHKKKKSKKHKEKERERLKPEWVEASPDLKQNQENINEHQRPNTPVTRASPEDLADYLLKYNTIMDSEQRQRYSEDFCAEYDEYIDLHERIGKVTQMFVQLGSKIKTLSPGTQEYKVMEEQIMEKYRKYKKKFPGYREEKKRCEYLHQKLSHIKGLILDYDHTQAPS
ncbi:RNA polymerase II elongation factor ELL2 isoform X1 [Triplophysa rosa]|uniref:RNA polymerase II elongation factor ELL2 n=1 Tax=Triplophysa rosa TaxID=992332 RepID=A0A9W7TSM3_TRIRA|nr:RNA polymerase II elongation factor ELL2 isoform X1 [Triplophysa rosa]KAI7802707.1 putative RNA polymerase II elongation factor ELL2 [Triplophysa rosa]